MLVISIVLLFVSCLATPPVKVPRSLTKIASEGTQVPCPSCLEVQPSSSFQNVMAYYLVPGLSRKESNLVIAQIESAIVKAKRQIRNLDNAYYALFNEEFSLNGDKRVFYHINSKLSNDGAKWDSFLKTADSDFEALKRSGEKSKLSSVDGIVKAIKNNENYYEPPTNLNYKPGDNIHAIMEKAFKDAKNGQ